MTATTLDPTTALIVVDLQKGVLGIPAAHPVEQVVGNSVALIEAFRRHGLPIVLVNVTGGAPGRTEQPRMTQPPAADWADLIPELGQQASDLTVTKKTWGSFTGTDLHAQLSAHGVTQLVVVGIATTAGVESTARHAHELGYNVTLAVDAMTDRSREAHENSVTRIFPRLGETGTTEEIIALLDARS